MAAPQEGSSVSEEAAFLAHAAAPEAMSFANPTASALPFCTGKEKFAEEEIAPCLYGAWVMMALYIPNKILQPQCDWPPLYNSSTKCCAPE
jgi:hypothetical protein